MQTWQQYWRRKLNWTALATKSCRICLNFAFSGISRFWHESRLVTMIVVVIPHHSFTLRKPVGVLGHPWLSCDVEYTFTLHRLLKTLSPDERILFRWAQKMGSHNASQIVIDFLDKASLIARRVGLSARWSELGRSPRRLHNSLIHHVCLASFAMYLTWNIATICSLLSKDTASSNQFGLFPGILHAEGRLNKLLRYQVTSAVGIFRVFTFQRGVEPSY